MESIVVAIGGNALLSPSGRQSMVKESANMERIAGGIARLSRHYNVVITHGNGSQVGDELMRNEHAKRYVPKMPLYIINAETQASIGSLIETVMRSKLKSLGIRKDVSVMLAHVIVDKKDNAFRNPTKQIGPFYTKEELESELELDRFHYIKMGEMYRRVVASPKPIEIVEARAISDGLKKGIVITCGGGGIPTANEGNRLKGVNSVIDKDLTSQLLANSLNAKRLVILTNAEYVYSDHKHMKNPIRSISAKALKTRLDQFEEGTIRPKLDACIKFVENGGKEAYIGNIFMLDSILKGRSGTKIMR